MPLTTLANVKQYLKIPATETGDDNILARLISVAQNFIESYCGKKFEAQSYTEYHSTQPGQTVLMLNAYPVNSITSIHDDPARSYGSGALVDPSYYILEAETGIIRLDGVYFLGGLNNVKAVYNAGWAVIPYDIEQAAIELVAQKYHSYDKIRLGVQSRSFEGESVSFFLGELYPETKAVLGRYKKVK